MRRVAKKTINQNSYLSLKEDKEDERERRRERERNREREQQREREREEASDHPRHARAVTSLRAQ